MSTAIVTDLVLNDVESLFERGLVTPSTLFAANSLVQAVVLHDDVILGMTPALGGRPTAVDFVENAFSALRLGHATPHRPKIADPAFNVNPDENGDPIPLSDWLSPYSYPQSDSWKMEKSHFEAVHDFFRARKVIGARKAAAVAHAPDRACP